MRFSLVFGKLYSAVVVEKYHNPILILSVYYIRIRVEMYPIEMTDDLLMSLYPSLSHTRTQYIYKACYTHSFIDLMPVFATDTQSYSDS